MKITTILGILAILTMSDGWAQSSVVEYTPLNKFTIEPRIWIGYAHPQMNDMKAWQAEEIQYFKREFGVSPIVLDPFPGKLSVGADLGIRLYKSLSAGVSLSRNSTGSRMHYGDYSGSIASDWVLSNVNADVYLQSTRPLSKRTRAIIAIRGGLGIMRGSYDYSMEILSIEVQNTNNIVQRTTYHIEPGIGIDYELIKNVSLNFIMAYHLQMGGTIDIHPDVTRREQRQIDWSGLRFQMGIKRPLDLY